MIADGTEGVEITGSSQSTTLQGNHIGVSIGGGALLNSTRSGDGIFVTGDSTINQIGDASSANGRNVIDGDNDGIRIDSGFVSAQTSVMWQLVGINTTGQVALGNGTGVHDHRGTSLSEERPRPPDREPATSSRAIRTRREPGASYAMLDATSGGT